MKLKYPNKISYYHEYCDRHKPTNYLKDRYGKGVDKQFTGDGIVEEPLSWMNIGKWELSSYLFLQYKHLNRYLSTIPKTNRNGEHIQYLRGKMDFIKDLLVDMGFDPTKGIMKELKYDRKIEELV